MVLLLNGLGKWTSLTLWLRKFIYKVMDLFIFLHMNISETNVFILLEISRLISCTHSLSHSLHSHGLYTLFKSNLYYMYFYYFHSFLSPLLSYLSHQLCFLQDYFSSIIDTAWCRIGVTRKWLLDYAKLRNQ